MNNRLSAQQHKHFDGQCLIPAIPVQERLRVSQQFHVHPALYTLVKAYRILGILKLDAAELAIHALQDRHPSLRQVLVGVDDTLYLRPNSTNETEICTVDLSAFSESSHKQETLHSYLNEATKELDPEAGPLFRTLIIRVSEQEHMLCFSVHRLLADEFALAKICQEFSELYQTLAAERTQPSDPIARQPYTHAEDILTLQANHIESHSYTTQLDYWKSRFCNSLPTIDLPISKTRPAHHTFNGTRHSFELPDKLHRQVQELSAGQKCSIDAILLGAFKALLYRYSTQSDILVGSICDNRNSQLYATLDLDNYVGPLSNIAGYRTQLDGQSSFRKLLADLQATINDALENRDVPFDVILQELKPPRDFSRPPLFQIWFQLLSDTSLSIPNAQVESMLLDKDVTQFDLGLNILETSDGLKGFFEYNVDLFDAPSIKRLTKHYLVLLEGALEQPDCYIDALSLLTQAEREKLLVEWNQTDIVLPGRPLIHSLVEEQTAKTPEQVAVHFGDEALTYAELNHRADTLARYLRTLGVSADTLVGIYVERSLEMMIGLLGILKSGGAYVPLDPAFPSDRLAYMAQDADVSILLTQESLVSGIFEHSATVICLDSEWASMENRIQELAESEDYKGQDSDTEMNPNNLAYVIYTSGSTGKPKGVQVPHRAAANFLLSMAKEPGIDETDTLVAVTTLSFDIALLELYLPLIRGAKVVIASREESADAHKLQDLMIRSSATMLQATPATWRMLLDVGWQRGANLSALCGGEPFPVDVAERLIECCASVWNMYGPTETTVWSTIHPVASAGSSILIGRPIANTEIFILDSNLNPVPIGIPGLLYIGGAGLARGYLNQPTLTDEKFIPHPFSVDSGIDRSLTRIYNTGDMAKYHPDGTIECLGRVDHQVKIRGFRIELGEIESLLGDHPRVRQSVVVAREDVPGNKTLVAYLVVTNELHSTLQATNGMTASENGAVSLPEYPTVVATADTEHVITVRELRNFLNADLPDYMIPSAFVFLDELPLTPNGKVDRLALPRPNSQRADSEDAFVAPRNLVEQALAEIWEEHTNIRPIGVNDNFFELGGTSLIAVRIFGRIEKEFGRRLPLATLFEASTVAELAVIIGDTDVEKRQGKALVRIKQGTDAARPPIILCHGAGGAVLLYRALAEHLAPEQSVYGLQAIGLDIAIEPHTTIEEMADYYLDEILTLQPDGPYFLGGYCMGGTIAFELAQRLIQRGESVELLAMLETYNWINGTELGAKDKLVHTVEKIDFHLRNLFLSDTHGKRLFFREKFEELMRRFRMGTGNVFKPNESPSARTLQELEDDNAFATTSKVWEINDVASLLYEPAAYPGRITHITTCKQYACYSGPHMGWQDIAGNGIDSVVLNVYPAGMLNEPFVVELADEIQIRIDRALNAATTGTLPGNRYPDVSLKEDEVNALRVTV